MIIKYPAIAILALVAVKGINLFSPTTSKQMQAIEVSHLSRLAGKTYYRIYHLDSLILYQSQYLFDSSFKQFRIDSATQKLYSEDTLLLQEWRSRFFVFHQDSSYGYRYDPYRVHQNGRLPVDATIKSITGTDNFNTLLAIKPDSVTWNDDKSELKEVYAYSKKKETAEGRFCMYYSKKLNHLKHTFNKVLDSAKKMKLFKTEFIFSEFYSEKDKILWPPVVDRTEMRQITVKNPEEIVDYFNRYKKASKNQ